MSSITIPMSQSGERVNYLTLALEARGAIKRLELLLKTKQRTPELTEALQSFANSLKAVLPPRPLYSKLYEEAGYSRFEEIQTLNEVSRTLNDAELASRFERIVTAQDFREDDVRTAIKFFSAIENRALYHYNDPSFAETSD